eukprot:scaffold98645_cov47-Attheya_sp.AAC.3
MLPATGKEIPPATFQTRTRRNRDSRGIFAIPIREIHSRPQRKIHPQRFKPEPEEIPVSEAGVRTRRNPRVFPRERVGHRGNKWQGHTSKQIKTNAKQRTHDAMAQCVCTTISMPYW